MENKTKALRILYYPKKWWRVTELDVDGPEIRIINNRKRC
jgi:hypothetical protein